MRFRFRLRANVTKKVDTKSGPDGARRNGKRVELRKEEERLAWLARKGDELGFRLGWVRASGAAEHVVNALVGPAVKEWGFRRRAGDGEGTARLTLAGVLFEGELEVTDAERFRRCLAEGIGPGKAYGMGLMSVAPAS